MAKIKNKQQELFCRYYITEIDGESFNATKAAIKAGYSKKTAAQQASRLLSIVNIQLRISELQKEAFKRCEIDADYVLNKFKKIADDDISNYLKFYTDENGDIKVHVNNSEEIDTWNISEVSIGKDGQFKFKTHCKDNALVQLGKHLKLFTDKVEHSGEVDINNKTTLIDKYIEGDSN